MDFYFYHLLLLFYGVTGQDYTLKEFHFINGHSMGTGLDSTPPFLDGFLVKE